ncbi:MAG: hypothetical protein VX871_04690 [Pseudomonadota bacterium]|nr:hypothetical protein [Pseudomonadota bacterium]
MLRKTLIATAAAAAIGGSALIANSPAKADISVHLGIPGVHIGTSRHHGYYGYGYRDRCWTEYQRVKVRYWSKRHHTWRVRYDSRPVRVCR